MKSQFESGLVFKRINARGKVFVEYIPAENAWSPIEADGYLFINCFWVSGQFKGQGYANRLLDEWTNEIFSGKKFEKFLEKNGL